MKWRTHLKAFSKLFYCVLIQTWRSLALGVNLSPEFNFSGTSTGHKAGVSCNCFEYVDTVIFERKRGIERLVINQCKKRKSGPIARSMSSARFCVLARTMIVEMAESSVSCLNMVTLVLPISSTETTSQ